MDQARSYRLLVHAEFEHYVEERCLDIARAAVDRWKADGKASRVALSLLARGEALKPNEPSPADLTACLSRSLGLYERVVNQNNGMKLDDLTKMLERVGIEESEMPDTTWQGLVNSFGRNRGAVAHKSIGAAGSIDPESELKDVLAILEGFRELDSKLSLLNS